MGEIGGFSEDDFEPAKEHYGEFWGFAYVGG